MAKLSKFFDVGLIDTALSLGVRFVAAAALIADYVLPHIELEAYSIQTITTTPNIRKGNPKIEFLGMIPSKVDSRNSRHK